MRRVVVIGNGGGGKSTLCGALHAATGLPWIEVDRIQFGPGWSRVEPDAVSRTLAGTIATDRWIIDGFGPWQSIEDRCARADTLIYIDHPIWVHFWWAAERQIAAARGEGRYGGPDDCPLEDKTEWMFRTLWRVHIEYRPRLLDLARRCEERITVHHLRSPAELDAFVAGLSER